MGERPVRRVVAVESRVMARPDGLLAADRGQSLASLGTKREDAFVQLGVTESSWPNVVPELSNLSTTTRLLIEDHTSHGKHEH